MGTTAAAICNEALALIDSQTFVTGTPGSFTDGSPQNVAGAALNILYPVARDLLLREMNPEFARITGPPTLLAPTAGPVPPWTYEYAYPAAGVRIRCLRPPVSGVGSLPDPNDPYWIRGAIAYDPDPTISARVILTNQQNALVVYTNNAVPESQWDSGFAFAISRQLAEPLSMALAGRPDFAKQLLETAQQYASLAAENTDL